MTCAANAASSYAAPYESYRKFWNKRGGSPQKYTPEDFVRVVLRALRDTPPRPRYTLTRSAWVLSLAKRLLSDRAFDGLLLRLFGFDKLRL